MNRVAFLCLAMALAIACNGTRTFEDAVKNHQAVADNETPEFRAAIIQLAKRHVQKYERDCRIQGVTAYPWAGTTWQTAVDCLVGESRTSVHLNVDLFVQDDGSLYWKTEYVPPSPDARPFEFATEPFDN